MFAVWLIFVFIVTYPQFQEKSELYVDLRTNGVILNTRKNEIEEGKKISVTP